MFRVLGVALNGYYDWLKHPLSERDIEDARLLRLIRALFTASHGIHGAPRVFLDLREAGETCSKHRVALLMRTRRSIIQYAATAILVGSVRTSSSERTGRSGRVSIDSWELHSRGL